MLNYSSNEKEKKLLILAHLLITASSAYHAPSPDRKTLILGHGFVHSNVESCASVRMLAVLQTEARPWSRAAFQDAEQISSPEERAASEHFLPAAVTSLWTDQLWQAVCQNVTILSLGMCSPALRASSLPTAQLMSGFWVSECFCFVLFLCFSCVACADVTLTHRLGQGVDGRVFFFMDSCCLTSIASSDIRNPAAHIH